MKVLIIMGCSLPVPAVKGGAVGTLVESIIKENEKQKELKLSVFTLNNTEAKNAALKYQSTDFIWFKENSLLKCGDSIIDIVRQCLFKKEKKKKYLKKLSIISRTRKLLATQDYDAVILQNAGFLLKIFKKQSLLQKYKDKIYYHVHNDVPDNIDVDILKQCKILLISNYLTKKLIKMCGNDIIEKCLIVKNGINTGHFHQHLDDKEIQRMKEELGITTSQRVILFVGRIAEEKGVSELLDAVQKLDLQDIVLLLIGSTNFGANEMSQYEKSIKEKCMLMGKKVITTGFIHNSELWKYHKLADVAVFPSMWEEPAGLTIIEAMASGLPVITTESGGIPEYTNNKFCIMINRDDNIVMNLCKAIKEVLENLEEWKNKGKLASKYVEQNLSEEVFYKSFIKAIKKKEEHLYDKV